MNQQDKILKKDNKDIETLISDSHMLSLHRYFIWANRLRIHFDECLEKRSLKTSEINLEEFMYMSLWYASLYVVCEGWQKLDLKDSFIESLLASKNLKLLRRYRNATYHFQKNYYHEKVIDFISGGPNVVSWVRKLNNEFGRFFLNWIKTK
jgi:hypothetical protein